MDIPCITGGCKDEETDDDTGSAARSRGGVGGKPLISVCIPTSVTAIEAWAFRDNQLTSVSIPSSVTAIGELAFTYNQLTSVSIPANVDIQESSFYGLLYVHYIANNRKAAVYTFSRSNSGDFEIVVSGNAVEITGYHGGKTELEIPGKINTIPVTYIGCGAFIENQFASVSIPNSVTAIGDLAFAESALTSVSIGANVQVAGGEYPSFDGDFAEVYTQAGKQAGTYRFSSGT
jgi:hypothetical protein